MGDERPAASGATHSQKFSLKLIVREPGTMAFRLFWLVCFDDEPDIRELVLGVLRTRAIPFGRPTRQSMHLKK